MITDQPMKNNIIVGDWFMVVCLDGYEPELARIVTETISEQSEETITMLWNFAADEARRGTIWN